MPSPMRRRGLLQRPRGPFAFPGTKAGVDPSYGLVFSAVPAGANCTSLLQGAKIGSVTGGANISASAHGAIGSAVTLPPQATNNLSRLTFSGNVSTNFGSSTIAAIIVFNGITATQAIFANDSVGAGVSLNITGAGTLQWTMFGVVARSSSITLVANVPYFLVASHNGTTGIDYLAMRLDNGVIVTSTSAGGTPNAPNGTYVVGNSSGSGNPANGQIAAVAFSGAYNPPAVLRKWCADPWGLWYPR